MCSNYSPDCIYSGLTADPACVRKRVKLDVIETVGTMIGLLVVKRDNHGLIGAPVYRNLLTVRKEPKDIIRKIISGSYLACRIGE